MAEKMKAITYRRYGGVDVLEPSEVAFPVVARDEILVRVEWCTATTADWRLRAGAFPGITALPGRLMFGITRPRRRILGNEFAGTVIDTGADTAGFAKGDAVVGMANTGAYGAYIAVKDISAVVKIPASITMRDAVALPFGGLSALVFLRDMARVQKGERVMIIGASGGVGIYAVQIARILGAHVTAVASKGNHDLVRGLGADAVIDYQTQAVPGDGPYDVILDCFGAIEYAKAQPALARDGRFVPLNFTGRTLYDALRAKIRGGTRVVLGVSGDTREDLETLLNYHLQGALSAVIQDEYSMDTIKDAHLAAQSRHRRGAIVINGFAKAGL